MPLPARDYKKILEIIEVIYSIPNRTLLFQTYCKELQTLVRFPSAALIASDPASGNFLLQDSQVFNTPMDGLMLFCLYYWPLQPLVTSGVDVTQNFTSMRITDVISASRHSSTEYCRDFQVPLHIFYELNMTLKSRTGTMAGIGMHRSRTDRDFTDREKEIIDILLPHLSRALGNIDDILKGQVLTPSIKSRLERVSLSIRQQEIAFLVMQGFSNREIARRLYISEQTVKDHLVAIFETMKVRRRGELTARILGITTPA